MHGVLERRGSGAMAAIAGEHDPVEKVEVLGAPGGGQGTMPVLEAQLMGYLFQKPPLASVQRYMLPSSRSPVSYHLGHGRWYLLRCPPAPMDGPVQDYGPDPFASVPLPQPQLLVLAKSHCHCVVMAPSQIFGELPLSARTWVRVADLGDDPRKQVRKAEGESQWRKGG